MFRIIEGIKILNQFENKDILSFSTTKYGGFSKNCYSQMNMGFHVGDDSKNVNKNYTKLKSTFKLNNIQLLSQIHSNKVIDIDYYSNKIIEADGLFTGKKQFALGILTADCYNVQLIGSKSIANLHCGWRSIYSGIIQNAIDLFNQKNDNIEYAIIGVGICSNCYEVSKELYDKFELLLPDSKVSIHKKGKYFVDLRKAITHILKNYNIGNIISLNHCSSCDENFYSHRRDNGKTGRMLSIILRK